MSLWLKVSSVAACVAMLAVGVVFVSDRQTAAERSEGVMVANVATNGSENQSENRNESQSRANNIKTTASNVMETVPLPTTIKRVDIETVKEAQKTVGKKSETTTKPNKSIERQVAQETEAQNTVLKTDQLQTDQSTMSISDKVKLAPINISAQVQQIAAIKPSKIKKMEWYDIQRFKTFTALAGIKQNFIENTDKIPSQLVAIAHDFKQSIPFVKKTENDEY